MTTTVLAAVDPLSVFSIGHHTFFLCFYGKDIAFFCIFANDFVWICGTVYTLS